MASIIILFIKVSRRNASDRTTNVDILVLSKDSEPISDYQNEW